MTVCQKKSTLFSDGRHRTRQQGQPVELRDGLHRGGGAVHATDGADAPEAAARGNPRSGTVLYLIAGLPDVIFQYFKEYSGFILLRYY